MATITWTSAVAGNWNTGSNWSGGVVPGPADDVVFDGTGSGNCTVDVNVDINSIYFNSYTGTFSASSFTFTVADYADADGTTAIIDLGSSSWTVGGSFLMRYISASSSVGTSSLTMTNTTSATFQWLSSGGNFNKLTLGPNANIVQGRGVTLIEAFILGDGATWQGGTYTPGVDHGCDLILGANSSITFTTGKFWMWPDAGATRTGDPTATVDYLETRASAGDGVTWTIPQATYGGIDFRQNNSSQNGIWTFEGDTVIDGEITTTMSKATNETIDTATNNANLTLKGNVDITPLQGTITWSAGTGTITLAPTGGSNINFNGQTVDPIHVDPDAVGPILLTGNVTTSWFRDCAGLVDVNGFTLTYDNVDRCAVPYNPTAPPTLALKSGESINNGLVGYWPLTDGTGTTAKDISTSANDGTQIGGVSWAHADLGAAASFDGTDDYFDLGDNYDFGDGSSDNPFSVSGWMYLDSLPAAGTGATLFGKTGENVGDTNGSAYNVSVNSSGVFSLRLYDNSGGNQINAVSAASAISTGTWYHLAATYDGGGANTGIEIYIDGVNVVDTRGSQGTYVAMENETSAAKIGAFLINNSTYQQFADGNIQNVRVWNTALTAQQVSDIYTTPWLGSNYEEVVAGNTYFFPAHFGGRL